jgi:urease accessory protein
MARGLGAELSVEQAPFEPEAGAYHGSDHGAAHGEHHGSESGHSH